ncbi:unnamed protein product [Ilex paraguariensis]|uniref:Uncharacterized protein n=1 Tax=Ilex paraguariensis TaxID=185542 RepID=A0ABC8RJH2_9AQUA
MGDEGARWQRIVYEKNKKFCKASRKQGHSEEDCQIRKPQENLENRDLITKEAKEMYEEDTMRVTETGDQSEKDNSSFPQADTRSPTDPTEEIREANKETLDITKEEIQDTRKETLEKTMEDVRETSQEALETAIMANPNEKMNMQNSALSFLAERDYSCAENMGLTQDDERDLICAKLPPDKGF